MNVHFFNQVAENYTAKVSPYRYSQFLALVHELNIKGNENVLDIGCGPGPLSMEVAAKLPTGNLLGIDLSENMIKLARELAARQGLKNVEFQIGDALSLDLETNSLDIVFSSNAFPWVADQKQFLRETYRVLKTGGRLGLVSLSTNVYREFLSALRHIARRKKGLLPNGANTHKVMKFKRYSIDLLQKEVVRAGFSIRRAFQLSTEEPITPRKYLDRVNAIVGENYLDGLKEADKKKVRTELYHAMARNNGNLKITESSVFIIAVKK
jgi:ubiquinone/menaquinone biosynthesis C-methylase UbiE